MRCVRETSFQGLSTICLRFRGCPSGATASLGRIGNTTNSLGRRETTRGGTCLAGSLPQITPATTRNITASNLDKAHPMAIQRTNRRVITTRILWRISITWRADHSACRTQRSVDENTTTPVQGAPTTKADTPLSHTCWTCTAMAPLRFSRRAILGHSRTL